MQHCRGWVGKAVTYVARLITGLAQIAILIGKGKVWPGSVGDRRLQMGGRCVGSRGVIAGEHQKHRGGAKEIAGSHGRVVCFGRLGVL